MIDRSGFLVYTCVVYDQRLSCRAAACRTVRAEKRVSVPAPASSVWEVELQVYAIIEAGGKQYRVQEGDVLLLEKMNVNPGETVEIDRVLAVKNGDTLKVGQPLVEGAKVVLKVLEQVKGPKIIVFKYKPKKNYRRKKGHRQPYTKVQVEKIIG